MSHPMHGSAAGAVYDALLAVWRAEPDTVTHAEVSDLAILTAAKVAARWRHAPQADSGDGVLVRLTAEQAERLQGFIPAPAADCCADCDQDAALLAALDDARHTAPETPDA